MHGSYQAECDLLVQQNLDGGQIYAQKVAYSATLTQNNLSDPLTLYAKTQLLREQNLSFNSVIATNHNALGETGAQQLLTTSGESMLVGYATIEQTEWNTGDIDGCKQVNDRFGYQMGVPCWVL